MSDLSVIIPGRNEEFMPHTIEDILRNIEGDTEIIAVCDGYWPDPPIKDDPRVHIIHHTEAIGQRQSTNEGVRMSRSKFIMKCDAHCAFDKGFDVKLMESCEKDCTIVPSMYRLHVFDWACECGHKQYQDHGNKCEKCGRIITEKEIVWRRRKGSSANYMWFDTQLKFSYFDNNYLRPYKKDGENVKRKYSHKYRDWAKENITDQMVCIGACWLMHRQRYWDIGGMDEGHGSWGQMGVELACKSWLSGGRQLVNKNTWFAHMFRTTNTLKFPYPIKHSDTEAARKYSRDLWFGNKWLKAKHDLKWLIDKFSPLPGWDEYQWCQKG